MTSASLLRHGRGNADRQHFGHTDMVSMTHCSSLPVFGNLDPTVIMHNLNLVHAVNGLYPSKNQCADV